MLNSKKHRNAKQRGYDAGINNVGIEKNPYSVLGSYAQVYAALWETGYQEGVKEFKEWKESDIK